MGLNFTINNELVVPYSRYMQGFCFKQTLITFLLMGRLPSVHRLWSLYHKGFNSLWSGNSLNLRIPLAFTSIWPSQISFLVLLTSKNSFSASRMFFSFLKKKYCSQKWTFGRKQDRKKYQRCSRHSLRFQVWYFEWNKWRNVS